MKWEQDQNPLDNIYNKTRLQAIPQDPKYKHIRAKHQQPEDMHQIAISAGKSREH